MLHFPLGCLWNRNFRSDRTFRNDPRRINPQITTGSPLLPITRIHQPNAMTSSREPGSISFTIAYIIQIEDLPTGVAPLLREKHNLVDLLGAVWDVEEAMWDG